MIEWTDSNPKAAAAFELARLIEAKDPYTAGHTWRVANYGQILAAALDYAPERVEIMLMAGSLHDIGKIAVPDDILTKPGRLTDDEFAVLKRHPAEGYNMLKTIPGLGGVLDVVLMHHEAYDGRGYPLGLAGQDIPHEARLFAVVDAFDAMTSQRCYRAAMPVDRAIEEIERNLGRQFDPEVGREFIQLYCDGLLEHILGHSDFGMPVGNCPKCGPILEMHNGVHLDAVIACPACGTSYRLEAARDGHLRLLPCPSETPQMSRSFRNRAPTQLLVDATLGLGNHS